MYNNNNYHCKVWKGWWDRQLDNRIVMSKHNTRTHTNTEKEDEVVKADGMLVSTTAVDKGVRLQPCAHMHTVSA